MQRRYDSRPKGVSAGSPNSSALSESTCSRSSREVINAVARLSGLAKARASLLPITNDSRVPMMQIYALFAGKAKPDDVLAAAKAGTPTAAQLRRQLFYANLYLGLYYEALGNGKLARKVPPANATLWGPIGMPSVGLAKSRN